MRHVLKLLLPATIRDYFRDLQRRLSTLETLVDTLIESPMYEVSDAAGFNGQLERKQLFKGIVTTCGIEALVETGTWIGNTTGYMAEMTQLPVYSSEINPRFYQLAKRRLANFTNIHLAQLDSCQFLRQLSTGDIVTQCVFFYLDSHWYNDLPLREEIALIAGHWQRFVIMVDDFQVPHDRGYGYDRYGSITLNLRYIQDMLTSNHLVPFFPTVPSSHESGSCRGCVVITRQGTLAHQLATLDDLSPPRLN